MPELFTRILVPTDFSEPSDAALAYAKQLAHRLQAAVHVLHVIEDPLTTGTGADGFGFPPIDLQEELRAQAARELDARFGAREQADYRGTTEVRMSAHTAAAIVEVANERETDLIVMGTHGRTGLAHLLLGSVAERVVRTAGCPVLTVRRAAATASVEAHSLAPPVSAASAA